MDNLLTQQEMEALLSAIRDGSVDVDQSRFSAAGKNVQTYDFRRPDRFSREQLRTLQRIYGHAAQSIATSLSSYLRLTINMEATSIEEVRFETIINSLPELIYLNIVSMDPLEGKALLIIDLPSALAIVDRLLGGKGEAPQKIRALTEIEQVVAENAVSIILRHFKDGWKNFVSSDFQVIQREMEPRFVHAIPSNEVVQLVTFKISGELGDGEIKFCVPLFSLEPIISKLTQEEMLIRTRRRTNEEDKKQIRNILSSSPVEMTAKIGSTEITIQDLLELKVGSVIRLREKVTSNLTLEIDGKRVFTAKPGLVGRKLGAQITAVA